MGEIILNHEVLENVLYDEIRTLVIDSRNHISTQINSELLKTYWEIGKKIVIDEQNHSERAEYGKKLLKNLSKELTKEFGKGFSKSNLFNMRKFYLAYPIFQTVSGKLSWSHYSELLSMSDNEKRSFYEREIENSRWSVRELKRQISTSLYERLLLSSGKENKEKVLELALKGNEINTPSDIVKDPYVFEFLGIPEEKPILESDNSPIGIILCTDKDNIQAEYALGGISNTIFASKYTLYIPKKEILRAELEKVITAFETR